MVRLDKLKNIDLCTGCSSCVNVCPTNAIKLERDTRGFYKIQISNSQCINCLKCYKVCQLVSSFQSRNDYIQQIFCTINKDVLIRQKSSSGGLFIEICKGMKKMDINSTIYGVEFDNNLQVNHVGHKSIDKCQAFIGSKYVQSDVHRIFSEIKLKLEKDEKILFSGTGCQCQGLKLFLRENNTNLDNLILVDLICHGVSSPSLWDDYISELEKINDKKIIYYSFRDKSISWAGINPKVICEDKEILKNNLFLKSYGIFFGNLALNNCCYSCNYTNLNRVGDLTLGDYWGIPLDNKLNDGKGVSELLINSSKGFDLFEIIKGNLEFFPIQDKSYIQPQLVKPTKKNIRASLFWHDYQKNGYYYVYNKYIKKNKKRLIKQKITQFKYRQKPFRPLQYFFQLINLRKK